MSTGIREDAQDQTKYSWTERTVWAAAELVAVESRMRAKRLFQDFEPEDEEFL